jgi:thioredoxin-like negative regulator of GroEL
MTPLLTQLQYEELLRPHNPTNKYEPIVGIAFGAEWCGPCQRLDKDKIVDLTPGVKWYYCDVDQNDYTLGYCGIRSIPSFVLIQDGIFNKNTLTGAGSHHTVAQWVKDNTN